MSVKTAHFAAIEAEGTICPSSGRDTVEGPYVNSCLLSPSGVLYYDFPTFST